MFKVEKAIVNYDNFTNYYNVSINNEFTFYKLNDEMLDLFIEKLIQTKTIEDKFIFFKDICFIKDAKSSNIIFCHQQGNIEMSMQDIFNFCFAYSKHHRQSSILNIKHNSEVEVINNHTCIVCNNNRCNKQEKSCWKCGFPI